MSGATLNPHLVPVQRFAVMGYLGQVEKSTLGSVARRTGLTVAEVSKAVRLLEKSDYVTVPPERPDEHADTVVFCTPAGRTEITRLIRTLRELAKTD